MKVVIRTDQLAKHHGKSSEIKAADSARQRSLTRKLGTDQRANRY